MQYLSEVIVAFEDAQFLICPQLQSYDYAHCWLPLNQRLPVELITFRLQALREAPLIRLSLNSAAVRPKVKVLEERDYGRLHLFIDDAVFFNPLFKNIGIRKIPFC